MGFLMFSLGSSPVPFGGCKGLWLEAGRWGGGVAFFSGCVFLVFLLLLLVLLVCLLVAMRPVGR
jgi:hypothetical protein